MIAITITPTSERLPLGILREGLEVEVQARVWLGRLPNGQPCRVHVVAVEFETPRQLVEFERDLAHLDR